MGANASGSSLLKSDLLPIVHALILAPPHVTSSLLPTYTLMAPLARPATSCARLLSSCHYRTVPHTARSSSPPNPRLLALTHSDALLTTSQPNLLETSCTDLLPSIRVSLLLLAHIWTLWAALLFCAWIYSHYLSKVVGHLTGSQTHFSLSD